MFNEMIEKKNKNNMISRNFQNFEWPMNNFFEQLYNNNNNRTVGVKKIVEKMGKISEKKNI